MCRTPCPHTQPRTRNYHTKPHTQPAPKQVRNLAPRTELTLAPHPPQAVLDWLQSEEPEGDDFALVSNYPRKVLRAEPDRPHPRPYLAPISPPART